jgi:hypothetical protein
MAQQLTNLIGGHAPAYEQYPVKAVIVSRFLRAMNLVLHGDFHDFPVSDLQTLHRASSLPPSYMAAQGECKIIMLYYL